GTFGIGADDEDVRVALLEIATGARDRSSGAHGDNHSVDLAVRLFQDLGARLLVVSVRIGHVRVLVGLEGAGNLRGEAVGDRVVALRRIRLDGRWADHDLRAVRAE